MSTTDLQSFPHVCTVEDIAASVVFLASGDAASITGHNLVVDCALSTCIAGACLDIHVPHCLAACALPRYEMVSRLTGWVGHWQA